MTDQHKISEYIDNLQFKKSLCMGIHPDEVYEVICNLTSMYNEILASAYEENESLKNEMEFMRKNSGLSSMRIEAEPVENKAEDDIFLTEDNEESVPEAEGNEEAAATENKDKNVRVIDKGVQKLKRGELLEILIEESRENQALRSQVSSLEEENTVLREKLQDRRIKIEKAGTLAEAALSINGIFDSAHAAAKQYLDNLEELYEREAETIGMKEEKARKAAQDMLDDAIRRCDEMTRSSEDKCSAITLITQERCDMMKEETEDLCRNLESSTRERCIEMEVSTKQKCDEKLKQVEDLFRSKTREIEDNFLMKEKEINERCERREAETKLRCEEMLSKAQGDVDKRWEDLSGRLEEFYRAHVGLRELLSTTGQLPK